MSTRNRRRSKDKKQHDKASPGHSGRRTFLQSVGATVVGGVVVELLKPSISQVTQKTPVTALNVKVSDQIVLADSQTITVLHGITSGEGFGGGGTVQNA